MTREEALEMLTARFVRPRLRASTFTAPARLFQQEEVRRIKQHIEHFLNIYCGSGKKMEEVGSPSQLLVLFSEYCEDLIEVGPS